MKSSDQKLILELARLGAPIRLRQIQEELKSLYRRFPELRAVARSRRTMSNAARKKISAGMRARWAARRAQP